MTYSNELSIYHGSDTWESLKKGLDLLSQYPFGLDKGERLDLQYLLEAMLEIEGGGTRRTLQGRAGSR